MIPDKREINKKYLKIGGYTALVCLAAAVGVIIFNLLAGLIPSRAARIDTSRAGFYSFGEKTKALVRGLDRDVKLYIAAGYGNEDNYVLAATGSLCSLSPRMSYETVAPTSETVTSIIPGGCAENSVIAVCGDRYRIADINEIYEYTVDRESGTYKVSFDYENVLYSAISYVSREEDVVAYYTSANGETVFSQALLSKLGTDNIEYRPHDLSSAVPPNADCLVICSPTSDLGAEQTENLKRYLDNGGKLFLVFNPNNAGFENLISLIAGYGLEPGGGVVIEEDENSIFRVNETGIPYLIYPSAKNTAPASELYGTDGKVLIQMSNGIFYSGKKADGVNVTELLVSTDSSFMRPFGSQIRGFSRSDGDTAGPFCVSALIEKDEAEIIWTASSGFADDMSESYSGGMNSAYVSACMRFLTGSASSGAAPKPFGQDSLDINGAQKGAAAVFFVLLIPAAFLICGAYVVNKRKNK